MSTVTVNQAAAALFGRGNADVSKETIRTFINQPGRTAEEVVAAAVEYNVNKKQIAEAMAGDERFTKDNIDRFLAQNGIKEPPRPVYKESEIHKPSVMLRALHGSGNSAVSDSLIQEFILATGRTVEEVVDAAAQYGVSAEQITRAMAGHKAFTPESVNEYLASVGFDRATLVNQVTSDWTQQDFDQAIAVLEQQGLTLTDLEQQVKASYEGVAPLMEQARVAQDMAAQRKGEYDAIAQQVGRGTEEFERLVQELELAQALKQQAQADLEAGQQELAYLDEVTKKRDRRATAQANGQHKIDAAQQRLEEAQKRIDIAQGKIDGIKSWGEPLLAEQAIVKAAWEQAAAVADEKTEVANAQLEQVAQLAQDQNTTIADMTLAHDKLIAYLSAHPDLASSEQAHASIQNSVVVLEQTLEDHRAWTDAVVAQGEVLNDEAIALEMQASELRASLNLDDLLLQRSQAEARLGQAQQEFDEAKAALTQAQQVLDDAYQARMDANYEGGKGARNRARDEADRRKVLAQDVLKQAEQRFAAAQADLETAHAETIPVIEQALKAVAQWAPIEAQVEGARAQVDDQIGLAGLVGNLENAVHSGIAAANLQLIGVNQTKVLAAQQLASQGELSVTELATIEKSVRLDLEDAVSRLQVYEQTVLNDRLAEGQARAEYTALQAQASGQALIADNLISDAEALGQSAAQFEVESLKEQVAQAAQRLQAAKERHEMADMRMDWAEGKVNPKKQARDTKNAAPELEAAQKELTEAKQVYDELLARLMTAETMAVPLRTAAQQASFSALVAVEGAQRASVRADTAAVWSGLAQARFEGADTVLATAQLGVVEGTRALAQLQHTLADVHQDEEVSALIEAESVRNATRADEYAQQIAQARAAQADTQTEQLKLDALVIEAGAVQTFNGFLQAKVDTVGQTYQHLKETVLPELETQFALVSEQARADGQVALDAHNRMMHTEGKVGLEFVGQRLEPVTPAQMFSEAHRILSEEIKANPSKAVPGTVDGVDPNARLELAQALAQQETEKRAQQRQDDPQSLLDSWLDEQLKKRKKSTRKTLHLLDDLEQWKNNNPEVQAARQDALQAAQGALDSGLGAIKAGQNIQAHLVAAVTQNHLLEQTQNLVAETSSEAAELSEKVARQAGKLAQTLEAEQVAIDLVSQGIGDYIQDTAEQVRRFNVAAGSGHSENAQLLRAQADGLDQVAHMQQQLVQNAQTAVEALVLSEQGATEQSQVWSAQAGEWQTLAAAAGAALETAKTELAAERDAFKARSEGQEEKLTEFYQMAGLAKSAVDAHAERNDYNKELHERRERIDRVHKKRKKKSLFKTIVNIGAMIAAAYLAAPTGGSSLSLAGMAESAAIFTAANAAAQGINIAAGWQDTFSKDSLLAAGSAAVFFHVASPVAQAFEKAFEGTFLAVGRHATNIVETIPQGSMGWLGKGIADAAGGVAGNILQQGFDVVTGRSDAFNWDSLKFAAALWGISGAVSHMGGPIRGKQFPSVQGTNPLYNPFFDAAKWTPTNHVSFLIRRTYGMTLVNGAMYALGLKKDFNIIDGLANGIAISMAGFGLARVLPEGIFDGVSGQYLSKFATLAANSGILHLVDGRKINWDGLISTSWGWSFGVTSAKLTRQYLDANFGEDPGTPMPGMAWLAQPRDINDFIDKP